MKLKAWLTTGRLGEDRASATIEKKLTYTYIDTGSTYIHILIMEVYTIGSIYIYTISV